MRCTASLLLLAGAAQQLQPGACTPPLVHAADAATWERKAGAFLQWMDSIETADRRAGLRWISNEYGFGVFTDDAHGALDDGSLLVQLPLRAVVCRKSLVGTTAPPTPSAAAPPTGLTAKDRLHRVWQHMQDDVDVIALWLMRARAVGALRAAGLEAPPPGGPTEPDLSDPAAWWPYIDVLPRYVNVPATWPVGPAGMGLLHDERAEAEASVARGTMLERYARALPAVREVFSDFSAQRMADAVAAYVALETGRSVEEARAAGYGKLPAGVEGSAVVRATPLPSMPGGDARAADPTLDLLTGLLASARRSGQVVQAGVGLGHDSLASFVWAATLVDSRALTMRGEHFLVPLADMLNYVPSPGAQQRVADSGAAFLAYHQLDFAKGVFRVLADRSTPREQQVYEDYGDSDSGLYLQHHGMVPVNITRDKLMHARKGSSPGGVARPGVVDAPPSPLWSHSRVRRVDGVAGNPFDCVRLPLPALKAGPKNSTADRRRTLAQALGLSPSAVNRTCIRPPPVKALTEEGSDLLMFESGSPDPVPLSTHMWMTISLMDRAQLASGACSKIMDAYSSVRETKEKGGGEGRAGGNDAAVVRAPPPPIPAAAAGTVSITPSERERDEARGFTQSDVNACLLIGEAELPYLLEQGTRDAAWLDYGLAGKAPHVDDGSEEALATATPKDIFLSGLKEYHPKTMYGRTARLIRRLLVTAPTRLHEDLALLSVLETTDAARADGTPPLAMYALAGSCMISVDSAVRRRWLLAHTFGWEGGMYDRSSGAEVARATDEEEDGVLQEEEDAPRLVHREHVRLALYYRASRKSMLKDLQQWLEEQESALLHSVKVELDLVPGRPPSEGEGEEDGGGTGGTALPAPPTAESVARATAAQLDTLEALVSGNASSLGGASVEIGHASMGVRDAACYFTEDEFAHAEEACSTFNDWLARLQPAVNHIKAVPVGGGMRLGVVTTAALTPEQVYLAAPLDAILDSDAARKDRALGPVIAGLRKKYPNGDDLCETVLLLLLESGVRHWASGGAGSTYGPYLDLLPDADHMPFPVFFTPREMGGLLGSANMQSLLEYRHSIRGKYSFIKPLILDAHPRVFTPPAAFSLERYRWGTAILDSRAIWWGGARHLVPLLDLINCGEGPTVSRVHATRLDPRGEYAVTRADRSYAPGEQVWENYGQPNWIYFSYHGFSLLKNSYDCVKVELGLPPFMAAVVGGELAKRRSKRKAANVIEAQGGGAAKGAPVGGGADTAAWAAMAALLAVPRVKADSPAWARNVTLTLPWAASVLPTRQGKGPSAEGKDATPSSKVAAWLASATMSSEDEPYTPSADSTEPETVRAAGEVEVGMRTADVALWGSMRALMDAGSSSPRLFSTQCIKPDALLPPVRANSTRSSASVDGAAASSVTPPHAPAPADSPRWKPHADTESAIEWLRWGWNTDRAGALLLLRAHARAGLAKYPALLAADVRSLLADAGAQLVLGLASEDDAAASVKALLAYVYGDPAGWSDSETALPLSVAGGLPSTDTSLQGGSPLPGAFPLGRFTVQLWQSEVLAQAKEASARGAARLARARAALLPPRLRASTFFLLTEKVQLLALAGWDPLGRGGGRYHPLHGACTQPREEGGEEEGGEGPAVVTCGQVLNIAADGTELSRR